MKRNKHVRTRYHDENQLLGKRDHKSLTPWETNPSVYPAYAQIAIADQENMNPFTATNTATKTDDSSSVNQNELTFANNMLFGAHQGMAFSESQKESFAGIYSKMRHQPTYTLPNGQSVDIMPLLRYLAPQSLLSQLGNAGNGTSLGSPSPLATLATQAANAFPLSNNANTQNGGNSASSNNLAQAQAQLLQQNVMHTFFNGQNPINAQAQATNYQMLFPQQQLQQQIPPAAKANGTSVGNISNPFAQQQAPPAKANGTGIQKIKQEENDSGNESDDRSHDTFAKMCMESHKLYEIPVEPQKLYQAMYNRCIDQIELNMIEHAFDTKFRKDLQAHQLRVQTFKEMSDKRFFEETGLVESPGKLWIGGYHGKAGNASNVEKQFMEQPYSCRKHYYMSNPGRTDLSMLMPQTPQEIRLSQAHQTEHFTASNKRRKTASKANNKSG